MSTAEAGNSRSTLMSIAWQLGLVYVATLAFLYGIPLAQVGSRSALILLGFGIFGASFLVPIGSFIYVAYRLRMGGIVGGSSKAAFLAVIMGLPLVASALAVLTPGYPRLNTVAGLPLLLAPAGPMVSLLAFGAGTRGKTKVLPWLLLTLAVMVPPILLWTAIVTSPPAPFGHNAFMVALAQALAGPGAEGTMFEVLSPLILVYLASGAVAWASYALVRVQGRTRIG